MAYDKLISLGGTCTPTWQLRTFSGSETLYPLDWVLTPFTFLVRVLQSDVADPADLQDWQRALAGARALPSTPAGSGP